MLSRFLNSNIIIKNEKLLKLYTTFNIDPSHLLPVTKPPTVQLTPFQYHSTVNQDPSYITNPRLSVTKLLTENWCELREYYSVYSGSIRSAPTEAIKLGSKYHELLELEDFEIINIEEFINLLYERLGTPDQIDPESSMAQDWFENIVVKLFNLITKSHTREVLVHDYLDIDSSQFSSYDKPNSILISGIIDHIRFYSPKSSEPDWSLFEDIQTVLELDPYIRPQSFVESVIDIIKANDYQQHYKLQFTDVKTRQQNRIPHQKSVLRGAYLQVCYYKYFFDKLSSDPQVGYEMLIENAKRKGCDVDKPIDVRIMFSLLRKYPELLVKDFESLAGNNGSQQNQGYNLTDLFDFKDIEHLKERDSFDYDVILNENILKQWNQPLTLRYFAKISSSFFSMFEPFNSSKVSVEYHNVKTNYNFRTVNYEYKWNDLKESIESSSKFWNGTKIPQAVSDLSRCKYCDFNSRCSIPNKDMKHVGVQLVEFLNT